MLIHLVLICHFAFFIFPYALPTKVYRRALEQTLEDASFFPVR